MTGKNEILSEIDQYYTEKIMEFGEQPKGVDWNDSSSQNLRFEQLLAIVAGESDFSINDLGCGYGALLIA